MDALRKALTHARFLSIAWLVVVSPSAMAFTFADGTHADCIARGATVMEAEASPGDVVYQLGRVAIAAPTASGYRIVWNNNKLKTLPPEMHDFIFFHECAHARLPTTDELRANCAGLKEMRSAGKAGFAVEAKLAAFYGPRNSYWENTLTCANGGKDGAGASQ